MTAPYRKFNTVIIESGPVHRKFNLISFPGAHQETIDSDATIVLTPYRKFNTIPVTAGPIHRKFNIVSILPLQTINSDAVIVTGAGQKIIYSDAIISGISQKTLDSDAVIRKTEQEIATSDAKIVEREQNDILSDAYIYNTIQHILSDAKIKELGIEESIFSDARLVSRIQEDIGSDAEILSSTHTIIIDSDAVIHKLGWQFIISDAQIKPRIFKEIESSAYVWHQKDFYAKLRAQVSTQKDFNVQLKVSQPAPTNPTGLTVTDLQTGEALFLSWTDTGNYGYNVYKDVGGTWVKQNQAIIQGNAYTAGDLTAGITYTFQVRGVNGVGDESSGVSASGTPTYNIAHYKNPSYEIYIDGSLQSDAILESVELIYGPSFSTARFYIPKNPSDSSLPDADKQEVEVKINDRLVFTGILLKREDSYEPQGLKASYTALNKLWEKTLYTVGTNVARPVGYPASLWNPEQVADMTGLEYMEFAARYRGNYKIHCDEYGNISYYKVGSPLSTRTFEIGKQILRHNISKDHTKPLTKVVVLSEEENRTATVNWHTRRGQPSNVMYIGAREISNIQVFALINQKPEVTQYLEEVEVLPGHVKKVFEKGKFTTPSIHFRRFGETEEEFAQRVKNAEEGKLRERWGDGGSEGRHPIKAYRDFDKAWVSVSANVEYDEDGDGAKITVSPMPKVWHTNTQHVTCVFKSMEGEEPKETEFGAQIWNEPYWTTAAMRVVYTYKGSRRIALAGSGDAYRTYHESITPYRIRVPSELPYAYPSQSNFFEVDSYLISRASGESARHSQGLRRGTLTILGDETVKLRTKVNDMEVVRVVHDFSGGSGFLTHIDLTDESFFTGVAVFERKEMLRRKSQENINKSHIRLVHYDMDKVKAIVGQQETDPGINPKAGIAYYSD